jgi:serine/threonine-protein kinase
MDNFGRYQIIDQLGTGAMGAVYKARDPMMGRDVAVKTILTHVIEGPQGADFRERFFREARAAGRLAHPGIVTVYDVSEHEGTPFLVMEYVAGSTLQSILESGERMDLSRIRDLSVQLADALDYAHRNGVVHRDIKPANILITPEGRLKIADFGVARLADAQVTSTGYLLGTPAFMAPEQFTGAPVDGRADIFAAGVIIYWMATGDKPFSGDSILSVQYKVVNTEPVPPRKLNPAMPRELESIILKCLAKDPAERYQSGEQLAMDLRASASGQTLYATAVAPSLNDAATLVMNAKPLSNTVQEPPFRPATSTTTEIIPHKARSKWVVAVVLLAVFILGGTASRLRMYLRQAASQDTPPAQAAPQTPPATALNPPPPVPPPPTPDVAKETPKVAPAKPNPVKPPVSEKTQTPKFVGVNLELTASQRTNVVFESEGHPTEALTMKPGDTTTLHADQQATLTVTNTTVLEAKLNGKSVSFPDQRRAGRFTVTADGIQLATPAPGVGSGRGFVPNLDLSQLTDFAAAMGRGNATAIGSPARQKELAQSASSVHLLIKSSAIPEFLTVVVRVDDAILFRRDATAPAPDEMQQLPRRYPATPISAVPFAEERLLPPGSHHFQVSLLIGAARLGQPQELTSDFSPGQRQSLTIEFARDPAGGRGNPMPRLHINLN